jgi:GTP cyclohydrolase II
MSEGGTQSSARTDDNQDSGDKRGRRERLDSLTTCDELIEAVDESYTPSEAASTDSADKKEVEANLEEAESEDYDEDEDEDRSMMGLVVADSSQRITHISRGFTDITGYSSVESIGKSCSFLQGPSTNQAAVDVMRKSLGRDRECRVSVLNYRKDGTPFWNTLTISPVMDSNGRVTSYIGIQMTQQRQFIDQYLGGFSWTTPPRTPRRGRRIVNKLKVRGPLVLVDATVEPEGAAVGPPKATVEESAQERSVQGKKTEQGARAEVESDDEEDEDQSERLQGDSAPSVAMRENVSFVSETNLPTRKGVYRVLAFKDYSRESKESEVIVLAHGDVVGRADVPCRVHDQCFTSEVIGSLKCDCKEQLDFAMDYIKDRAQCKGGLVIYMPQEGRGIGLVNKIKAYQMQEQGLDTVDANRILGFEDDYREYNCVPSILSHLQVSSIKLMTNNPRKISRLESLGITISGRIPVICELNAHSENYVGTKGTRMGHFV